MLKRYLVSTAGKPYYITKFYINKIDNILRFGYDIHVITNSGIASMIDNINQSFINNPESDSIFNKLATEKKFSNTISQLEALEVISGIEKSLKEESFKDYIKVNLPRASLYFELNKVKLLYNFIKYFYDNYENIKVDIDKQNSPSTTADVKPTDNIEIKDISPTIFNELRNISPNNIITFFILKQISNMYTGQTLNFKLEEESNLIIEVESFTSNIMLLYNDLNILINFIPKTISDEEYKNIIKSKISVLIKLILALYENEDKLNINDKYLYINFIIILLYIYGFWLNGSDFNININLYTFVNKVIFNLKGSMGKIKNIKFIPLPMASKTDTSQVDISKINMLAAKYKYLIDFDRERFIKNIITDIESNPTDTESKFKQQNITLSKAKLLDLSGDELPLNYTLISDNNLKNHRIISKAYHSLLILENSINIFSIDNIDEQLPKLIDIINSKIIPSIRKKSEMVILNPSVILIYNIIEPNIINIDLSIKEKMYLIFEICIPFIHDNFKVDKFVDYFH